MIYKVGDRVKIVKLIFPRSIPEWGRASCQYQLGKEGKVVRIEEQDKPYVYRVDLDNYGVTGCRAEELELAKDFRKSLLTS